MNIENKKNFNNWRNGFFWKNCMSVSSKEKVEEIRIFSRDENKQHQMRKEINDSRVTFLLGM